MNQMNVFSSDYVEELFSQFLNDPNSVSEEWQHYFASMSNGAADVADLTGGTMHNAKTGRSESGNSESLGIAQLQDRVDQLVRGFRVRGHLAARLEPLRLKEVDNPELNPEFYGLLPSDMDKKFSTRTINGTNVRRLEEIVQQLRSTYCRYIGVQFMHIDDHHVREWLHQRIEGT